MKTILRFFSELWYAFFPKNEPATIRRISPKVGRNEPCPCGSNRKYKHCCLT